MIWLVVAIALMIVWMSVAPRYVGTGKLPLFGGAVLLAGPFFFYQFMNMHSLFYYPDSMLYDTPKRAGLDYEKVFFKSVDGTRLSGWFIPAVGVASPRDAKGTVIHLHGNAQNMTAHWQFVQWMPLRGFNLFVFDYRGYGESDGRPNPKGVFEDAVAALDHVRSRSDVDHDRLLVFGQSLGGTVAIAAAGASPQGVRAVAVEAPFFSYSAIANDHFPGAGSMMDDTYSASKYVTKLAPIPLLFFHGTNDLVVPYSHSVNLMALAGEPKRLITIEGGEHVDTFSGRHGMRYHDELAAFFEEALNSLKR